MTTIPIRWRVVLALCFWTLPAPAVSGAPTLRVTVTVPPLVWLIAEVAGPDVVVEHLVEIGEAPETFQPTDQRITRLARSTLLFRVGVTAENGPWFHALETNSSIEVVDLRRGLSLRAMEHHHHHHGHRPERAHEDEATTEATSSHDGMDPHIWLSPRRLAIMAGTVAANLAAVDPGNADGYHQRATAVGARLRALDDRLTARLAPVHGRAFFVFHPAWGYLADDYGLRQIAIEIEGKEPTEHELTRLVRRARTLGTHTLFVQPQRHSATPAALARALGARLETLDPLALDLPANLEHVAERLLAAMLPKEKDR